MKNTINDLEREKCTACSACCNSCHFKAITMQEDKDGFVYPFINKEACTECGMCARSCPVLNPVKYNKKPPELFAVRASDTIRERSSSGGMFTVLAEEIISRGGYVCGAAFDDDLKLKHIIADSADKLGPIRGSKYVQSETGMIYREIEKLLKSGKPVLFTGTPCQAAGLRSYLRKDYDDLYIMDVLCHGVPSQKIFRQYLNENFSGKQIKEVRFRDKRFGWSSEHILITMQDGSEYTADNKTDPYLIGFYRNITLRESCGDCPFAEFPRQGDFSVGDFWGISKHDKTQNDGKGTSIVYVNNKKAKKLFDSLSSKLQIKEFDFQTTEVKNRIHSHYPLNANRYRLFKFMREEGLSYEKALKKALSRKFDIGVVSNYYAGNFGGSLTQYALYNTLENMGYSCLMIERPADAPGKASLESMKNIYIELPYPSAAISMQRKTKAEMADFNKYCDTFVVGSDQLFQYALYNLLGRFVTLDWVDDRKKKIAYAASYGHDRVWGDREVLAEMGYYMRKFDAFSVREKSGVDISKNDFGVKAEWVLDPVFLCEPRYYDQLIAKSQRKLPKHYIGSYILDPSEDKAAILKKAQKVLGFKAQIFSEFNHSDEYVSSLSGLDVQHLKVEERLQLIKNCDFFVTDSFHGTCFAIIMGKPFISILNKNRGGSRFESLLSMFGISNRLIRESKDLENNTTIFEAIDYDKVYKVLDSERKRCLAWLKNALEAEKKYEFSDYDVLVRLIKQQQAEIDSLKRQVKMLSGGSDSGLNSISGVYEYLDELKKSPDDYTIFLSVKDTPGMSLNNDISGKLRDLGLKTDLHDKHWKSFAAVIDSGKAVYENISDNLIKESLNVNGNNVDIVSGNLKSGNVSKIVINNTEYSVNRRGINIVVIDKKTDHIADSVCFDMHLKEYKCYR